MRHTHHHRHHRVVRRPSKAKRGGSKGKRRRTRRSRYHGGSLGKWLKRAIHKIGKVAKPIYQFARKHKLISKGLSLLPDGRAKGAAVIARTLGFGKHGGALRLAGAGRRRRPRYYTRGYGIQP